MLAFILRRLGQAVLVMLAVGLIAFALFRFVGDPVLFMLGQDSTPEDRERITRLLGLDQPFYVQYAKFVGRAVQGEFARTPYGELRPGGVSGPGGTVLATVVYTACLCSARAGVRHTHPTAIASAARATIAIAILDGAATVAG